jgi:hypothetical protein
VDECKPLPPGAATIAALEAAVLREAPGMDSHDVSTIMYGFLRLGLSPGAEVETDG